MTQYTLKISPQGQLTLPRQLRERLKVRPGERVRLFVSEQGDLGISDKLPIEQYFGVMKGVWTGGSKDAADYARQLRDEMQPK